jgi:hypothetical protein
MSASNYLENKLLDHTLGGTAFTQPSGLYLALSTGSFADDNSGAELSGSNYSRKAMTFAAASSGSAATSAAVEFDAATGSWGTVSHWGIYDASTSGNLLFHGSFTASKTIATNDILKVASGSITISLD